MFSWVKKAKEIEQTTECVVDLEILPTWAHGISRQYKSEKFEATKNSSNGTSKDPILDFEVNHLLKESSYHETPKKKLKTDASTRITDFNICQLCKIVFKSKEDIATDSPWIKCSRKSCSWWVHTRCVGKFITFILFQFK